MEAPDIRTFPGFCLLLVVGVPYRSGMRELRFRELADNARCLAVPASAHSGTREARISRPHDAVTVFDDKQTPQLLVTLSPAL